jgi:hypothetical protein
MKPKKIKLGVMSEPKRIAIIGLILTVCLIYVIASPVMAQTGRLGLNPIYPSYPTKDSTPDYILKNKAEVTVDEANKLATLSFETVKPTAAGIVYYGLYVPQPTVWIPQYHVKAKEQLPADFSHEIKLDLSQFEEPVWDICDFKEKGAVIFYRLQLQTTASDYPIYYYGRFRVDQDYNQLPCVTEGPFVDLVKTDSATISFDTDVATIATVVVKGKRYTDGKTSEHHEISIRRLSPSTYYDYYLVLNGAKDLETYRFKTAPESDRPEFKFAVMSDGRGGIGGRNTGGEIGAAGGVNYDTLSKLFIDSHNRGAKFAVFGGDLINGYTTNEDDYRVQLKAWKAASELVGGSLPIYEVMGNHEWLTNVYDDGSDYGIGFDKVDNGTQKSAETVFAEEFVNPTGRFPEKENTEAPSYSENAYYFDYANSRFIILNTDYWWSFNPETYGGNKEGYVLDKQFEWLKDVLNKAKKNPRIEHVFVIGHEPLFPNEFNDQQVPQYLFDRRVALWEALSQNRKVVAAFFGHEHNYNRMLVDRKTPIYSDNTPDSKFINSVWQIVTGGVGAPFWALDRDYPWSDSVKKFYPTRHYCLISVQDEKVELTVISDSGEVVDRCMLKQFGDFEASKVVEKTSIRPSRSERDRR